MAKILSGTQIAKEILNELRQEVDEIREKHPNFKPKLAIVQVGGREDSNVYIRAKIKVRPANLSGNLPCSTREPMHIVDAN